MLLVRGALTPRGYWLVAELLCCYARCCGAEGRCPGEPAALLSDGEASGNVSKRPPASIPIIDSVSDISPTELLGVPRDSISLGGTHLRVCGAYFLAVCLVVCLRPGGVRGGGSSLLPCPRSWRVAALCYECTWVKLLCVVFLQWR